LLVPGAKLSVDASALPGDMQAAVAEGLKKKLAANKWEPADGQPVRLVATVAQAQTGQTMRYYKPGRGMIGEPDLTLAIERVDTKLQLLDAQGNTLWAQSGRCSSASRLIP